MDGERTRRHTRRQPCSVCGGGADMPQGKGIRCAGFTSADGEWCRCTREEQANGATLDEQCQPPAYIHHRDDDGAYHPWIPGETGGSNHGGRRESRKVYALPAPVAEPKLSVKTLQFLTNRGITESVAERFGLYSDTVWMPQIDGETAALAFPYRRDGQTVNVKYRDAKKHFRMVKDAEKILYNLDGCTGAETVAICEGEIDVLSLATAGFPHALSVPNGAPPEQAAHPNLDYLDSGAAIFAAAKKVILAVDSDGPGTRLETELARRIGREKCWRVTWPQDSKDANDVLLKHGAETLMACLNAAEPYPVEGIVSVRDVEDEVWTLYADGLPRGASTGWANLDRHYRVREGLWTLVTGIPGSGKSALITALTVNLARQHGWKFGVASFENMPVARHIATHAALYTEQPFADGPTRRMDTEQLDAALRWAHEHFAFIVPEEPSLDTVLERARVLVLRMGIRGLVIDPWNELDHTRSRDLTETEHVSRSLTRIRQFARHYGVHVWVVAHPTKLVKGNDHQYPVPTPYDISGSAHWFNKADNCLSVWRDKLDTTKPVDCHVQKVRFAETGSIGVAQLHHDPATGCYRDVIFPTQTKASVA